MTSKFSCAWFAPLALTLTGLAHTQPTRPGGHDVIPYTHATAVRGCTPSGSPALEIFFTGTQLPTSGEASPPYLRLELPSAPEETIPPATYVLVLPAPAAKASSPTRTGRAAFVASGQPPVWLSGTLAINSMVPGRYLNGHFRVEMPDGRVAESGFLARYLPVPATCGSKSL